MNEQEKAITTVAQAITRKAIEEFYPLDQLPVDLAIACAMTAVRTLVTGVFAKYGKPEFDKENIERFCANVLEELEKFRAFGTAAH
jgi:hypothetical protein